MYQLFKRLLFRFDPESTHRWVTTLFGWLMRVPPVRALVRWRFRVRDTRLAQSIWGVHFDNPVGLAAGFDKNAERYRDLADLGFGFVEIGTVTAKPQAGNPRPRLFRLPADGALINRMGFNNHGAKAVSRRLAAGGTADPLGVNIGRSKVVPNADAVADYLESLELLWPYASYITVNVSSPNTPELRSLQAVDRLGPLLTTLQSRLLELASEAEQSAPPLLLKIAPDLGDTEIDEIAALVLSLELDGIICTNTTISRDGLSTPVQTVAAMGAGGLSGRPLRQRSLDVVRRVRRTVEDKVPIIAVGGIADADAVWRAICAGAHLVQVYSAFIFEGPGLARTLNRGLLKRLEQSEFQTLAEARGSASEPSL